MRSILIKNAWCLAFAITLLAMPADAQEKRMLTPDDYKLWGTLKTVSTSPDGKWVAYHIGHADDKDSLYFKNVVTGSVYPYPKGNGEAFSPDSKWCAFMQKDSLVLLELPTGRKQVNNGVTGFSFAPGGRYLLSYNNKPVKTVWLKDLKGGETTTIQDVGGYRLSPGRDKLALMIQENGSAAVKVIALKPGFEATVLEQGKNAYGGLAWNKTGTSLAFYEQAAGAKKEMIVQRVYVCRDIDSKPAIKILDPLTAPGFPKDKTLMVSALTLSDDARELFLTLHITKENLPEAPAKDKDAVQIWRPDDKNLPPPAKAAPVETAWYVWWNDSGKMLEVADTAHPGICLTGDQKNVLLYNETSYLPQYKYAGDYVDIYIKNLATGEKKLLVKEVENEFQRVKVSPGGKYVTYFKDYQWWVYDINRDTAACVTVGFGAPLENIDYDWAGKKPPYGQPGWLGDDDQLVIYDQFDIWLMSPDGSKKARLTHGRETNTTFRIHSPGYEMVPTGYIFGFRAEKYSPEDGMLITTLNNTSLDQGFCYWTQRSGMRVLVQKARALEPAIPFTGRLLLKDNSPFLYTEFDFDVSPRLILRQPSGKEQQVVQSNPQQQHFYWGKSALVDYDSPDGQHLKGALFYPANYDPAKKYPMIVYIYERLSRELHMYDPPSQELSNGFNVTNFTNDGYFVLEPDIAYKLNDPGISAANCVTAAVKSIIAKNIIDKDKIGLMGFSFGGYETGFIITQTNIFKTAIAGAGFHNLIGFYLGFSHSGQNMWRFENQQQRIQTPYYGPDFQRNSTIMHAKDINTPLLLFAGTEDGQVDWTQSRELQAALWRLGKKSTLLVYPGEGHGLYKESNQVDITMRVKTWFDYYLKGEKPAGWILD